MTNVEQQLEKAREREAKAKARVKQLSAKLSTQKRRKDTRKKILIGSVMLDICRSGDAGWNMNKLEAILNQKLTRDHDREVFGFSPLDKQVEN